MLNCRLVSKSDAEIGLPQLGNGNQATKAEQPGIEHGLVVKKTKPRTLFKRREVFLFSFR